MTGRSCIHTLFESLKLVFARANSDNTTTAMRIQCRAFEIFPVAINNDASDRIMHPRLLGAARRKRWKFCHSDNRCAGKAYPIRIRRFALYACTLYIFGIWCPDLPGCARLLICTYFKFPDAVLAARTSMFSLLNFKAVLGLAFTRVCVSLLQAVTAFQDLRTRTVTEAKERRLELVIFVFAALKIIACYTVRSSVSPCK